MDFKDGWIIYRCKTCNKHFMLPISEVRHSERESIYLTCNHNGKHKDISVVGKIDRYGQIHKCMSKDSYERVDGKIRQR